MKDLIQFDELFYLLPAYIKLRLLELYQSPLHHAEGTVYSHSKMVADLLPNEIDFQLCALFHDLGKIDTTKYNEIESGIKINSIGHEVLVDKYIEHNKKLFEQYNPNWKRISTICNQHMRAHLYIEGKMSNPKKRLQFEQQEFFEDIITFAKADTEGRSKENGLPIIICCVGIPGSGKSTWTNNFAKNSKYSILCPDLIREELTGNISDQSKNREVFEQFYNRLHYNIKNKINTVLDNTACNIKTIDEIYLYCKDKAILCFKIFDVEKEICKQRVKDDLSKGLNRSNVPEVIIDKMSERFYSVLDYLEKNNCAIISKME